MVCLPKGVWEVWTLDFTMMHSSSKACINSSTKRIYLGSTCCGRTIYKNGKLLSATKKGSFWWRDLLKLIDSYKGMALQNLYLAAQYIFGMMCGMEHSQSPFAMNKSLSLHKAKSLGPHSFIEFFTSLFLMRLLYSMRNSRI